MRSVYTSSILQPILKLQTVVNIANPHLQPIDDNTNPPPVPPKAARVLGLEEDSSTLPGIIHS